MKKIRIFKSLVVMSCFVLCQAVCAGENTGNIINPDAQLDGGEIRDSDPIGEDHDGVPEIDVDKDIDWSEDEADGDHAENPGMHDGYYNEVGGARFYTEHDINQWLIPDEESWGLIDFDVEQMLTDLWCQDGGRVFEDDIGFAYSDRDEWIKSIRFEAPDPVLDSMFHWVDITYSENGIERHTYIRIYECPPATANNKADFYLLTNHNYWCIYKDLAPLILLAIEKMENNPWGSVLNDLNLNCNFWCG